MASSSKDKDPKKSSHRRSSSSKSGEKTGTTPKSSSSSAHKQATSPQLPRQNSARASNMTAMPKATKSPATTAAPAKSPATTAAPAKSPSTATKAPPPPPPQQSREAPATATPANVRRVSAPAGSMATAAATTPASGTAAPAAAAGPQLNGMGGYGSMGPGGYESMNNYGYGSMGPGGMSGGGAMSGGYGSMGPGGMSGMNGMNGMNGYGSMGPGGYGSMGPGAGQEGMTGGYGSMGGGGGGQDGMGGAGYGSMYGGAPNGMGSMYGGGMGGPMGGSMYYGGVGGPMGSMYGMGGMGGGSMYGMNPMMMGGSMYGMNPMMGSMYGMGGGMGGGSMYGMDSMYGLGRYNSMGLGSNYASMYGLGRTTSRSSFHSSGGYVGGSFGGLWRAPSGMGHGGKKDFSIPPPSSKLSEDFPDTTAEEDAKKNRSLAVEAPPSSKSGADKGGSAASEKKEDKKVGDKKEEPAKTPATDSSATAGGKDGERKSATTPAVVVVDNNAGGKEDKAKSRAVPLALASSHRLTKQVNDNVHVVAVAPNASMVNKADKTVTIGGKTYTMDEVSVGPVDVEKSDLLTDIVEQTHCGHNVSLLALCGSQKYEDSLPTVTAVVQNMMDLFTAEEAQVTQVVATAVVFAEPDKVVDLLQEDDKAAPVKAEFGSNPIYGPCVMNTSEKKVENAAEAVAVVESAAKKAQQRGLVVVTYKIKQIRPSASHSNTRDVYVSSMLIAIVDDASMAHVKAAEKHSSTGPTPLFGNAIGGASRTVAIVQIPEKDAEKTVGDAVAAAQQLREVKNTPTRSGNVKRFVDYTERAAAASAKTSPETMTKINRMLKDAKELLAKPEETALVAYTVYGGGHGTASPASTTDAAAKKTGATPRTVLKAEETAAPRAVAAVAPAAAAAVAAEDENVRPEAERQVRLTVCVDGTTPMAAGTADEVVMRAKVDEVPECATLRCLRSNFRFARNVALLSAETQRSIALKDQYTWKCVENILAKCLGEPVPGCKSNTVELYMVATHKREVLCDLMAESTATKVMNVASSPLFGPILADTKHKSLREASEVKPALEAALAAAAPHMSENDATIIMTAVLKQVQESGDVNVASFLCTSSPTSVAVRGAMSKDPDYSRSLYAYAIGGPCVTGLFVGVGDDHTTNPVAKAAMDDFAPLTKQPNHASRDGSVATFLEYAKKSIAANNARANPAASSEAKERIMAASDRLQMMHDDYHALAKFPQENTPAYYIGEKRVSEAPRMGGKPVDEASTAAASNGGNSRESAQRTPVPIRSVVVVVDGADAAEGAPAMEVTEKEVVLAGEHYTPTEVVSSKGGTLRSAVIDEVHQVALNGFNAAMLTNDVEGSTVGISMAVKTIIVILRGLPQNSEAFWTVVVSKDHKVKDMLADNSPYYDLHLASSPLFGNVAYGANISPVVEAQVEPKVREVRNEVRENGGVGYIYVILRLTQPDGDVCMPSFLATIAGDNVGDYEKQLEARSNSRLLSTAVGGPCHTIYVAGVRGPSGEGAKPLLEVSAKVMKVQNAPLRSGSLKRFIAHTEPTLANMQRKLESGNGPNPALLAQIGRIGTMLKDARNMLSSPGGSAPAVYKR